MDRDCPFVTRIVVGKRQFEGLRERKTHGFPQTSWLDTRGEAASVYSPQPTSDTETEALTDAISQLRPHKENTHHWSLPWVAYVTRFFPKRYTAPNRTPENPTKIKLSKNYTCPHH
jgi:hypothetical protein